MIKYNQTNINLSELDLIKIKKIIESGNVVNGTYVNELEVKLQSLFKVKHVVVCANCTTGLIIAIKASGIQGKSIAVPAFTWFSTPYAITCNYNIPCFIDVDKETWLMEEFNEKYVDAILSVDVFGSKSSMKTNLPIIYDAAHGWGIDGLGNRGLVEAISFSHTKIVQGMQGGAILTNDDSIAEKCKVMIHRYGKMTELNAFVILKSIKDFDDNQKCRIDVINQYKDSLKINHVLQKIPLETNYSVFAILLETSAIRNKIFSSLLEKDVEAKIYYQPVTLDNDYYRRMVPNTFDIYSRILALPVYLGLEDEVEYICKIINEAV
jgi:dTDP-4-amino-4,6-dideoxyglucose